MIFWAPVAFENSRVNVVSLFSISLSSNAFVKSSVNFSLMSVSVNKSPHGPTPRDVVAVLLFFYLLLSGKEEETTYS